MATNEAGVVSAIQRRIVKIYPNAWVFKVVGSPFQMTGVPDLLVVINGLLFAFEVKFQRPGQSRDLAASRASAGQLVQIQRLRRAGAVADVVVSPEEVMALIEERLSAMADEQ